jgi:hypothetical protein
VTIEFTRENGGRPRKVDAATLRMAMAAISDSKSIAAVVATLYAYVNSDGTLKQAGAKILEGGPHDNSLH